MILNDFALDDSTMDMTWYDSKFSKGSEGQRHQLPKAWKHLEVLWSPGVTKCESDRRNVQRKVQQKRIQLRLILCLAISQAVFVESSTDNVIVCLRTCRKCCEGRFTQMLYEHVVRQCTAKVMFHNIHYNHTRALQNKCKPDPHVLLPDTVAFHRLVITCYMQVYLRSVSRFLWLVFWSLTIYNLPFAWG